MLPIAALLTVLYGTYVAGHQHFSHEDYPNLVFSSCVLPGWSCVNATDGLSSTISSVTFKCKLPTFQQRLASRYNHYGGHENYYKTTQVGDYDNFTLALSEWEKLPITSVTVEDCGILALKMHTTAPINIHTLHIENTQELLIKQAKGEHNNHPQNLAFKYIERIPVLPENFITHSQTKTVEFVNVTIGLIKRNAISVKTPIELFQWINVTTDEMKGRSILTAMEDNGIFHISGSSFPYLRPSSILIKGGEVLIQQSQFGMIQEGSLQIMSKTLKFESSVVRNHAGLIYLMSNDVTFKGNSFEAAQIEKLVRWTTNKTDTPPEQVSFMFVNNTIDSSTVADKLTKFYWMDCTSVVEFIEHDSDCSRFKSGPVPWLFNQEKNLTTSNLVVCSNTYNDLDEGNIPSSWRLSNIWPKKICTEED